MYTLVYTQRFSITKRCEQGQTRRDKNIEAQRKKIVGEPSAENQCNRFDEEGGIISAYTPTLKKGDC